MNLARVLVNKAIKDCSTCYYKYPVGKHGDQQYWRCSLMGMFCDTVKMQSGGLCDNTNKGYIPEILGRIDPVDQQDSSDKDVLGTAIIIGIIIGILIGLVAVSIIN